MKNTNIDSDSQNMRELTRKGKSGSRRALIAKNAVIGFAALIALGCSKSSPSESDLKDQLTSTYKDCDVVSVRDFKKTNGIQQQDGSYVMSVEYKIKVVPVPENEKFVREAVNAHDRFQTQFSRLGELDAEIIKLEGKLSRIANESDERKELLDRIQAVKRSQDELTAKWGNVYAEYRPFDLSLPEVSQKLGAAFDAKCNIPENLRPMAQIADFVSVYDPISFGKSLEKTYRGDFRMIKTDNGWLPEQLLGR